MRGHEGLVYRFGPFLLRPGERMLLRGSEPITLAGKAFDLLVALVSQQGHLLTKEELLRRVWPGVVVEEVNLSVNMSAIRKALACAPDAADWIETVPRQGYRFKAPVEVEDVATLQQVWPRSDEPSGLTEPPPRAATERTGRRRLWLGFGAVVVAVAAGLAWLTFGRGTPYSAVAVLPFAADLPASAPLADGIAEETI
ncbi:MAG TPA: transcriptional regulator, partial [Burkholderiales bacterium]|nr:transcriptional regulator [Burkholderiales bacterium]